VRGERTTKPLILTGKHQAVKEFKPSDHLQKSKVTNRKNTARKEAKVSIPRKRNALKEKVEGWRIGLWLQERQEGTR